MVNKNKKSSSFSGFRVCIERVERLYTKPKKFYRSKISRERRFYVKRMQLVWHLCDCCYILSKFYRGKRTILLYVLKATSLFIFSIESRKSYHYSSDNTRPFSRCRRAARGLQFVNRVSGFYLYVNNS
jgi:hypothetical protein